MKIAFASDHAAVEARGPIVAEIERLGHEVIDFGYDGSESVDYPDFAIRALRAFRQGEVDRVILMCGTGLGMSYVANKVTGVRCARCLDEYDAQLCRTHNNTNCLALRARHQDPALNRRIVEIWLTTPFEGGRHQRRIEKIESVTADFRAPDPTLPGAEDDDMDRTGGCGCGCSCDR